MIVVETGLRMTFLEKGKKDLRMKPWGLCTGGELTGEKREDNRQRLTVHTFVICVYKPDSAPVFHIRDRMMSLKAYL